MIAFPNAKINLGLNITGKRTDGFHNIETVFYPVPLYDALEIIPADKNNLMIHGKSIKGDQKENLVLKALELVGKDHDISPVQIHLLKTIPMGAGLGGGSADGAFMLQLLNNLYRLDLKTEILENYARQLGSDCAFFIHNKSVMATERGDRFEQINLDLSGYYLVLTYPEVHISTKEAYSEVKPRQPDKPLRSIIEGNPELWQKELQNDFEHILFLKYPELNSIKEKLYDSGALYASMTGSGSAIFGLFKAKPEINSGYKMDVFKL